MIIILKTLAELAEAGEVEKILVLLFPEIIVLQQHQMKVEIIIGIVITIIIPGVATIGPMNLLILV